MARATSGTARRLIISITLSKTPRAITSRGITPRHGMRAARRANIAEPATEATVRVPPVIGPPGTGREVTRHAGMVPGGAVVTATRPGATRQAITRRITIHKRSRFLVLNPVFTTGTTMARLKLAAGIGRIAVVAVLVLGLGAGRLCRAQEPQSRTLEQWLVQLKDADASKRRQAVVALGSFGPDLTKAMIAQVGELLKDSDQGVRHAAALSIGNFGPASKAALANVRSATKDESAVVRRAAVFALGNMGTSARSAVPELVGALC